MPFEDPLEAAEQQAGLTDDEAEQLDPSYEAQIVPLLPRIPVREADLLELYFIQKKRQADIAIIFGVTQAAISYRLERGIQRIKFLLSIPRLTEQEIREALPLAFDNPIDINILVGMWQTTCQSEVATKLGLTQGRVRHRFFRAVRTLREKAKVDARLEPYAKVFDAISSKKFNILREVKLPQWAGRGGDECA
jgi:DNA-directed RNA polymerase specialized sigma24 family protein